MTTHTLHAPSRPWYRHVWPWLLMLPPAAAIAFWAVILATMAGPPSLVVDDYAKIGLTYTEDRSRDAAAARLDASARLRVDRAGGHVSLLLERPAQAPDTLQLTLAHPLEASRDRVLVLTRNSAGVYHGEAGGLIEGRYDVRLTPPDGAWRLTGRLPADAESLHLDTRLGDKDS